MQPDIQAKNARPKSKPGTLPTCTISRMQLWKGAAPGTWWHQNDASQGGFHGPAVAGPSPTMALRHITGVSNPSPFYSFSTSYAIAHGYATNGGTVTGGYIYEVDASALPPGSVHDPVQMISSLPVHSSQAPGTGVLLAHAHDGASGLIASLANGNPMTTAPLRFGNMSGIVAGPRISNELSGLVWAIRDAEVLLSSVPRTCIVARHAV